VIAEDQCVLVSADAQARALTQLVLEFVGSAHDPVASEACEQAALVVDRDASVITSADQPHRRVGSPVSGYCRRHGISRGEVRTCRRFAGRTRPDCPRCADGLGAIRLNPGVGLARDIVHRCTVASGRFGHSDAPHVGGQRRIGVDRYPELGCRFNDSCERVAVGIERSYPRRLAPAPYAVGVRGTSPRDTERGVQTWRVSAHRCDERTCKVRRRRYSVVRIAAGPRAHPTNVLSPPCDVSDRARPNHLRTLLLGEQVSIRLHMARTGPVVHRLRRRTHTYKMRGDSDRKVRGEGRGCRAMQRACGSAVPDQTVVRFLDAQSPHAGELLNPVRRAV
jgi:hypothetical protein